MKYIETRTDLSKKLGALSALGVVAFAPLFGATQNAQAAPPDQAPAWGFRNRNNTNPQAYSLSGVVTSTFRRWLHHAHRRWAFSACANKR
jgi:hypothetical protein